MQLKGQVNENNQLWLAGNEVQSMDAYDAMMEAKAPQVILK